MNKLFISLLISCSVSFASVINGIAITVNDDPITLYDIKKTSAQNNVDKNDAVGLLIDNILYKQLVKKQGISVDVFDVNDYVEKLASINNMDVYTFKSMIKQKYPDYSVFENEAKKSIERKKLLEKIVKGQLSIASEEDMKLYYENNKDKFTSSKSFKVVKFSSKNKSSLYKKIKNPLLVFDDVQRENEVFDSENITKKLQYLLTQTRERTFTPIFTYDKMYTAFYIEEKIGQSLLPYDSVKNKIFNDVMKLREAKYLKEYFEKQKLTADIKIIR